jgi:phosphate-selective porin OprO/OprP
MIGPASPREPYKIGGLGLLTAVSLLPAVARAQDASPADANAPAAAAAPVPADARAAAPTPPPSEWQNRLDDVDQRARVVARKLELAEEAEAARRKEAPSFSADEAGFAITSADRRYQVRVKGLLQVDGRFFLGDSTLAANNTFVARRVRPILDGTLLGLVDFRFSPDFGNNAVAVTDAYLDAHPFPWLRLRFGKFKPSVGLERLQADQDLTFIERALDSNISANREIGVQLYGDVAGGIVRYEAAVYNGNADGAQTDIDVDESKTLGGRLFIQPFNTDALRWLGRLGLGVAFSSGREKGSAANAWLGTFRSAGQLAIFSYISNATTPAATVFASGRHARINPQLYYYNGPVGLLAEWIKEYQEVASGSGTGALNNSAGHVTASVAIGGDVTYEGLKPKHALDPAAGTWGALEIAGRYNWIDTDNIAFTPATIADPNKSVTQAKGFGLALNWQLSRNIKASGDYEQTTFTGGLKGGNRATEKLAIGRFQIAF